jgi:hypothetical protein
MSQFVSFNSAPSPRRLRDIVYGFAPAMLVYAGAENNVFDVLSQSPKSLAELAAATGTSERALRYLMEALLSIGVVNRDNGYFSLTPDANAFLVKGKPGYLGDILKNASSWLQLPEVVRTGRPVRAINEQSTGGHYFRGLADALYRRHLEPANAFAQFLANGWPPAGMAESPRLELLDIAAGSAIWSIAIARRIPQCRITAIDWPEVLPVARHYVGINSLTDRFTAIEGDVLETDFGSGYHLAILGHVLHSEGELRSRKIIQKAFNALAPGATIAVAEFIPNEDRSGPPHPLIFAIHMLLSSDHGDTFTFSQISSWLRNAGFLQPTLVPLPGVTSIITATKP